MSPLSLDKSSLTDIIEETESDNGTLTTRPAAVTSNPLTTPSPKKRVSQKPPASNSRNPQSRSPHPPRRPVREMLTIISKDTKTLPPAVKWLVTFPKVDASQADVHAWLVTWHISCPHMMSTFVPRKEAGGVDGVRRDSAWFGQCFAGARFKGVQLRAWKWRKVERVLREAGMDGQCRRLLVVDLKVARKMNRRVERRVREELFQWKDDILAGKNFQRPTIYRNPFVKTFKQLSEYEQLAVNEQVAEAKAKTNKEEEKPDASNEEEKPNANKAEPKSKTNNGEEKPNTNNEEEKPNSNSEELNSKKTNNEKPTSSLAVNTTTTPPTTTTITTTPATPKSSSNEKTQSIPKTKTKPLPCLRKLWSIARPAPSRFPSSFWESLSLV